jgi:hypothetical protein
MYTQSLGVDNSERHDSFFALSVATWWHTGGPLLRVIAGPERR